MKVHAYQKFRIIVLGLTQRFSFYPDSSVTLKWYTFSQGRKERYQYSQIYLKSCYLFFGTFWQFLNFRGFSRLLSLCHITIKTEKQSTSEWISHLFIALQDPSVSGLSRPTFFTPALCADNDPWLLLCPPHKTFTHSHGHSRHLRLQWSTRLFFNRLQALWDHRLDALHLWR